MATKMHDMLRLSELKKVFSIFDVNKDGRISKAELRNVFQNLGEHFSEHQISEMISVADKNYDGFIDFEEFISLIYPCQL